MHPIRFAVAAMLWSASTCYARTPSVLMISIDGMRPDNVMQADEHGL